ncbi:MAG: sigma-70 family RNA polymerase sigma factor, partial [Actinomycetota bacterium]
SLDEPSGADDGRTIASTLGDDRGGPPVLGGEIIGGLAHEIIGGLAERTGLEIDLVLQALDVRSAMDAHSLDEPSGADDGRTIASTLGDDDRGMERTEVAMAMRTVLATLPERERVMVELRFYQNLTQQEIADRMGMSQMHVSRLLRRSMATLREQLR